MQRISNLLQKLTELSDQTGEPEVIDIDLMLDYTKVIYADLLEMRSRIAFNSSLTNAAPTPKNERSSFAQPVEESIEQLPQELEEISTLPTIQKTEPTAPAIVSVSTSPDSDIRKIISINDKYQFVSELFKDNVNAYEDVLNRMNSFNTYPEAIGWLDEVHSENNWDDDNDTVVSFYNIINHYFASK